MNESDLRIYGHKPSETTQSLFYDMWVGQCEIGNWVADKVII